MSKMLFYVHMSDLLIEPIQPQGGLGDTGLETLAAILLALANPEAHMPVIQF